MFMQMVFSKVHAACHNIVNGIKVGSNSNRTDKHAADCCMLGRKVINNVAKSIRLLDKKIIFVQTVKISCK